jgi:hypothetical protein
MPDEVHESRGPDKGPLKLPVEISFTPEEYAALQEYVDRVLNTPRFTVEDEVVWLVEAWIGAVNCLAQGPFDLDIMDYEADVSYRWRLEKIMNFHYTAGNKIREVIREADELFYHLTEERPWVLCVDFDDEDYRFWFYRRIPRNRSPEFDQSCREQEETLGARRAHRNRYRQELKKAEEEARKRLERVSVDKEVIKKLEELIKKLQGRSRGK